MSVCFGKNTKLYNKASYPYTTVTPLSVVLWKFFTPEVNVHVRIVHTEEKKTEVCGIFFLIQV